MTRTYRQAAYPPRLANACRTDCASKVKAALIEAQTAQRLGDVL